MTRSAPPSPAFQGGVKKRRSGSTLSIPKPLVQQAFDKPFDKLKALSSIEGLKAVSVSNDSGPESIEGLTITSKVEGQVGESKG